MYLVLVALAGGGLAILDMTWAGCEKHPLRAKTVRPEVLSGAARLFRPSVADWRALAWQKSNGPRARPAARPGIAIVYRVRRLRRFVRAIKNDPGQGEPHRNRDDDPASSAQGLVSLARRGEVQQERLFRVVP